MISRMPWKRFWAVYRERWQAGEHVFIYGETGAGKTDLALRMMRSEPYSVILVTKPKDPIFTSPLVKGFTRTNSWTTRSNHLILSARPGRTMGEERAAQKNLFPAALDSIYRDGGWSVSFDEGMHMSRSLGMGQAVSDFFYLGRSLGLTGILCTQRPRYIPPVVPLSATHAFVSASRRADDRRALAELGPDSREMGVWMKELRNKHDFIYIDRQGEIDPVIINTQK